MEAPPPNVTLRQALLQTGLSARAVKERLQARDLDGTIAAGAVTPEVLSDLAGAPAPQRAPEVPTGPTREQGIALRLERTRLLFHRCAIAHHPLEALAHVLPSSSATSSPLRFYLGLQTPPREAAEELARIEEALARPTVGTPGEERLRATLSLDAVDLDALWLLAAPEVSPRHLGLLDQLNGARTQGAVTIAFLRHLLGSSPAVDAALSADGALRRYALFTVERGALSLAPRVLDLLLGVGPDSEPALDGIAAPLELPTLPPALPAAVEAVLAAHPPTELERLVVTGPDGAGVRAVAERLALARGRTLLEADLPALGAADEEALPALLREAHLARAVLLLRRGDKIDSDAISSTRRARLLAQLERERLPLVVDAGGRDTLPVLGAFTTSLGARHVALGLPPPPERERLWLDVLARAGLPEGQRASLATAVRAFPIGVDHMTDAVRLARSVPRGAAEVEGALRATCDRMVTHRLGEFAMKLETKSSWEDLVVPDDVGEKLADFVQQAQLAGQVLDQLGYGKRLSYGRGLTALFSGPSGTGKTMAATLIAGHLGVELYRVDLASVVSKYIGETEQHIASLFREASSSGAALLFDEADSLFAKRTDVKSSNDRYANLAVNFLLQKFEEHDGISMLTTNLSSAIDKAFLRRLRFHVEFTEPDATAREYLWRRMIPDQAPLAADVKLSALARGYTLSGGAIRNAVLRAAFRAAAAGRPLGQADLEQAARDEVASMGKLQWDPK